MTPLALLPPSEPPEKPAARTEQEQLDAIFEAERHSRGPLTVPMLHERFEGLRQEIMALLYHPGRRSHAKLFKLHIALTRMHKIVEQLDPAVKAKSPDPVRERKP